MSMSDLKRQARGLIHDRGAEPCICRNDDDRTVPSVEQSAAGLSLSVRFKTKLKTASPIDDGASILENIESLIFNQDQLDALALVLEYGMLIEIPGYEIVFRLDQEMDADGPLNRYWTVTRD